MIAAGFFGQGNVVVSLHEVDMHIRKAREETLGHGLVEFLADVFTQFFFDMGQVLLLGTGFTGQGQDACVVVQQPGAIELIKGRK